MKLSVSQLRRIIKEEVSRMLVMEAGYKGPYIEDEPGYYDPRLGDEPPGYEPPEPEDIPDLEGDFKKWYDKLKKDRPNFLPGDFRTKYNLKVTEHYMIVGNKLYLEQNLYDAINGQIGKMEELNDLFPGGVVRGLRVAGGSSMSESRRGTLRKY